MRPHGASLRRGARSGGVLAIAILALSLASCDGTREERETPTALLELDLERPPRESLNRTSLFGREAPPLPQVLATLEQAQRRDDVGGLFLRIGRFSGAWGRTFDLLEGLRAYADETGRPIHCHIESTDSLGYALAARACDRISMTPAGTIDLVGVAMQLFYLGPLVESLGLRADVLQMGRYKGAFEPLTRDDISDDVRESLEALLDDLFAALIVALTEGRGRSEAEARALLDGGPYDAGRARDAGLIDAVAFDDEARSRARDAAGASRTERARFGADSGELSLGDVLRALSGGRRERREPGPYLALVQLDGTIIDSEEEGPGSGRSGPFVRELRRLADDDDAKAVVLRISSPGGSALASDRMWHAVRRVAQRKPVIVSFGDVAASGGYYVGVAGAEILAHPTSLIGSIGVVGGKLDASELLERIGARPVELHRGANAAWTSPARGFTDGEREVLLGSMRSAYDRFLRRVIEGRPLDRDEVEALAEGRVWSGQAGLERELVDRQGGLHAAIALARERGELEADTPIVTWPRERTPLEALATLMGGGPDDRARAWLGEDAELYETFTDTLTMMRSLAGPERVLVTLPFALRLH